MKYLIFLFLFAIPVLSNAQEDTVKKVERPCPSTFDIKKGEKTYTMRYASNHPIAEANNKIEQLIIYIHGARRNGLDYYEWGEAAVKAANKDETTLFISPQFNSEKDLEDHKHNTNHLFWASNNWRVGDESVSSKKRPMSDSFSSFSLVDSMIARVCNKALFPKLKKIIVVGHSAGGQFTSRYAGMTPMPNILRGVYKFRFIIMNPSTYLYLDDRRPLKKDSLLYFEKPDATTCHSYNEYPRGFEKLNPYATKIGVETIKQQFLNRDLAFILGGSDMDMTDPSMDKTCGANLQGRYRLERGVFYYEYLQSFSKEKVHKVEVVPNVAHSGEKMVISKAALWYMFN